MSASKKRKKHYSLIQKMIIGIIIATSTIIIAALIILFFSNPERNVKNQISSLASDYYENYLYEKTISANKNTDPSEIFGDYEKSGLSTVYLRQLLYYKTHDKKIIDFLKEYCDENHTSVKFYPEPPYSKNSYRADFTYSCEFK